MNAQIVHDSWHRRGRTSLWSLSEALAQLGYVALGGHSGEPKDTVKEFYLVPHVRHRAEELFAAALWVVQPKWVEAQTNDPFLGPLLPRFAPASEPLVHLFEDGGRTTLAAPGVTLRRIDPAEHAGIFPHSIEPIGDWGLDRAGRVVATGGLFFHYNPPYGDIYMEVAPDQRGQGLASFLVQELRRHARAGGHIPAARCNLDNVASRRALERGGMRLCGQIVRGAIAA
jgi:RimJ/RimL family protein N-acetyltransferase